MECNEYHGIQIEAYVVREDRRWKIWLLPGGWIERDLKAEIEEGMAFAVDKEDGRTNGIYLKQVEYGI